MRDNEKPAAGTAGDRQATVSVQQRAPAPPDARGDLATATVPRPACLVRCGAATAVVPFAGLVAYVRGAEPIVTKDSVWPTPDRARVEARVAGRAEPPLPLLLCAVRLSGRSDLSEHCAAHPAVLAYWRGAGDLVAVLAADPGCLGPVGAERSPRVLALAVRRLAQSWGASRVAAATGAAGWAALARDPEAGPEDAADLQPLTPRDVLALAAEAEEGGEA